MISKTSGMVADLRGYATSRRLAISRWRQGARVVAIVKNYLVNHGHRPPEIPTGVHYQSHGSVSMTLRVLDTANGVSLAEINSIIDASHEVVVPEGAYFDPLEMPRRELARLNG